MTTAGEKHWAGEIARLAGAVLLGEKLDKRQLGLLRLAVDHLDPNAPNPLYRHWSELKRNLHGAELEEPAPFELKWVDLAESTRDLPEEEAPE